MQARCLKVLLGDQYGYFRDLIDQEETQVSSGPALQKRLNSAEKFLRNKPPFELGFGLTASIDKRIAVENTKGHVTVELTPQVEYCFDPAGTKRAIYAWDGIERFGPFSRQTFLYRTPNILVLTPDTVLGKVETFLKKFRDGIDIPNSRWQAGFAKTFGLLNPKFSRWEVPWRNTTGKSAAKAYLEATEAYLQACNGDYPNAAIVVILDDHAGLPDHENPYLHVKAMLLSIGIPVQEVRLGTITQYAKALQYINQNLSIALYAKMGGIPWTVDHAVPISDEIIIGMGAHEVSGSRFSDRQRYVGVTTVFSRDGNYLLSNVNNKCSFKEYPDVLRTSTLRILRELKELNGWAADSTVRVVFHTYKPLKNIETADIINACLDEFSREQTIQFAFVSIVENHPFNLFDAQQAGIRDPITNRNRGALVPERGIITQIGPHTRLLCTTGPRLVKRGRLAHPRPLLISLHPSSTFYDLGYLTEQVLKFTSLSWRSTQPSSVPVTVLYSQLIAELLLRLEATSMWSPVMLNTKLKYHRWFL